MVRRRLLLGLLIVGGLAPLVLALVLCAGRLLGAMGDDEGAEALDCIALGIGLLWAVSLILLVLALAAYAVIDLDRREPPQ